MYWDGDGYIYWAELRNSDDLQDCKETSCFSKAQWLKNVYLKQLLNKKTNYQDDHTCYQPDDLLFILEWLGLTEERENIQETVF